MKISRMTLLAALKAAEPALAASNNQLEVLSHFWFRDGTVAAFDGVFGIQVGLDVEFSGGVLGSKLIGILERSRARNVTVDQPDDGNLRIKAGSATVTFALKSIEEWVWDPAVPKKGGTEVTASLVAAIKSILFSVGAGKVLSAEQRGVTVIQNGVGVDLYSTDAVTLSLKKIKANKPLLNGSKRVILPTMFCEQLCKTAKKGFSLTIDAESAYCEGEIDIGDEKTDILLFSQLVDDSDPVSFEEILDDFDRSDGEFAEPGRKLKDALERAMVLLSNGETAEFGISRDKEKACDYVWLRARSPYGEVSDRIEVEGAHPAITVKIDAAMLRRGLGEHKDRDERQVIAITPDSVLISNSTQNFWHVVSNK